MNLNPDIVTTKTVVNIQIISTKTDETVKITRDNIRVPLKHNSKRLSLYTNKNRE